VVEALTPLFTQPVEAVVLEDLSPRTVRRRRPATRQNQHNNYAVGNGTKQALDERCSQEARGSRHGHALACKRLADHGSPASTLPLAAPQVKLTPTAPP